MKQLLILLAIVLGFQTVHAQTVHAQTPPDPNPQVSLARVSGMPNGLLLTIKLAEGWHTYWQYPGDAGIAPDFRFTGAKGVDVLFPVPRRFDENGLATFGYAKQVAIPIVTGSQQLPDVILHLSFAACAEICVPLEATVSTQHSAPVSAKQFKTAMQRVPRPARGGAARMNQSRIALDVGPYRGRVLTVLPYGLVMETHADAAGKTDFQVPASIAHAQLAAHVAEVVVDDPSGPVKLTIPLQQ